MSVSFNVEQEIVSPLFNLSVNITHETLRSLVVETCFKSVFIFIRIFIYQMTSSLSVWNECANYLDSWRNGMPWRTYKCPVYRWQNRDVLLQRSRIKCHYFCAVWYTEFVRWMPHLSDNYPVWVLFYFPFLYRNVFPVHYIKALRHWE